MKTCNKCGISKMLVRFYRNKKSKDGLASSCAECKKKQIRAYHQSPKFKERSKTIEERNRINNYRKGWIERNHEDHKEKSRARRAIGYRLETGQLTPDPCQVCGSTHRIEAHHYLGYADEHKLDVHWLCKKHHAEADVAMRNTTV